jgi:hypothetical protein
LSVTGIFRQLTQPRYNSGVNYHLKRIALALVVGLLVPVFAVASKPDDTAADAIALAFVQARKAAHLSDLTRIDRNTFGEKVCKHDLRMPSGIIKDVQYETSDPARLPDAARQLATSPDAYKVTARFGVGVCSLGADSSGKIRYSVLIATYESRWTSFWRIFWD